MRVGARDVDSRPRHPFPESGGPSVRAPACESGRPASGRSSSAIGYQASIGSAPVANDPCMHRAVTAGRNESPNHSRQVGVQSSPPGATATKAPACQSRGGVNSIGRLPAISASPSLPPLTKWIYTSEGYDVRDRPVALQRCAWGWVRRRSCGSLPVRGGCPRRRRWPVGVLRHGSLCARARCARRRGGRWR